MSESVHMSKKSVNNGFVSKGTGGDHSGYNFCLLGYFEWLTIVLYMIFFHHKFRTHRPFQGAVKINYEMITFFNKSSTLSLYYFIFGL